MASSTYPCGSEKVKYISYSPSHSARTPWRVCVPFLAPNKKWSEPDLESAKQRLTWIYREYDPMTISARAPEPGILPILQVLRLLWRRWFFLLRQLLLAKVCARRLVLLLRRLVRLPAHLLLVKAPRSWLCLKVLVSPLPLPPPLPGLRLRARVRSGAR